MKTGAGQVVLVASRYRGRVDAVEERMPFVESSCSQVETGGCVGGDEPRTGVLSGVRRAEQPISGRDRVAVPSELLPRSR